MDDLSLSRFTSLDGAPDVRPYVTALEAFDGIPELRELKALAVERGGFGPGRSMLDVGCGFGLETLRLAARAGAGGRVAGIDKSADFIADADRRAKAAGLSIDFRTGDAAALPWPDGAFDCVRAERLLIYLKDPAEAVREMRRVLRSGGGLALIEPDFSTTTVNLPCRSALRRALAHEVDTAVVQSCCLARSATPSQTSDSPMSVAPRGSSSFLRTSAPPTSNRSAGMPLTPAPSPSPNSPHGPTALPICTPRAVFSAPSDIFSSPPAARRGRQRPGGDPSRVTSAGCPSSPGG